MSFDFSYCVLLCIVWLFSLSSLYFSEEEMKGYESWGVDREWGPRKRGKGEIVLGMY